MTGYLSSRPSELFLDQFPSWNFCRLHPFSIGPLTGLMEKGCIMSVLIGILITFLVVVLVLYLINMLPLDGRAKQIARVVVIIIGIISLLKYLAVF